jgi:hypothetical protein
MAHCKMDQRSKVRDKRIAFVFRSSSNRSEERWLHPPAAVFLQTTMRVLHVKVRRSPLPHGHPEAVLIVANEEAMAS